MGLDSTPPSYRPSGNRCAFEGCGSLAAVGWLRSDSVWRSACEQHAEVIPPWRKGDRIVKTKLSQLRRSL